MAKIVFTTGAGISVPSGIRPYRGVGGIYTENPELEQLLTSHNYNVMQARVLAAIEEMKDLLRDCFPNAAHFAIAELEAYHDVLVITQNVDNLHIEAGSSPDRVVELHGNIHRQRPDDDGELRPDVVLFGENLPDGLFVRAANAIEDADVVVAIGTSGDVSPANMLLDIANDRAYRRECKFYYINLDKPEVYVPFAKMIHESAETAVPTLCEQLKEL